MERRTAIKLLGGSMACGLGAGLGMPFGLARAQEARAITVALQELRVFLDPLHRQANSLASFRVLENIFDKLFSIDFENNGALVPNVAESGTMINDTTWDIVIRSGVKFHDGSELTAEDVAFSYGETRMLGSDAPGYSMGQVTIPTLKSVEALDKRIVRFNTDGPDPVLLHRLTARGMGLISKKAYESAIDFDAWSRSPVGTGPFRVVAVKENEFIELAAHEDYWQGQPNIDTLRFVSVPELAVRIAGLKAGEFDIISTVTPDQIQTIEADPRLEVIGGDTMHFRTVQYDTITNPVLADVHLRRAMNLAIDRDAIIASLYHNRIALPNSHQHPSYGGLYNADRPKPGYDLAKARELLAASTYQGETLIFKTVGNYYTAELAETQILVAMWKALGVKVDIQIKENWAQVTDDLPRGINNSSDGTYFADPVASFVSRWGEESAFQQAGYWTDDKFNRLGDILTGSLDEVERRSAFQGMLDIFDWENPPGTVLHSLAEFFAKRRDLHWSPNLIGLTDFRPSQLSL